MRSETRPRSISLSPLTPVGCCPMSPLRRWRFTLTNLAPPPQKIKRFAWRPIKGHVKVAWSRVEKGKRSTRQSIFLRKVLLIYISSEPSCILQVPPLLSPFSILLCLTNLNLLMHVIAKYTVPLEIPPKCQRPPKYSTTQSRPCPFIP